MKAEVRFESAAATVAFADQGIGLKVQTRDVAEVDALRRPAKAGEVFFVEAEDPWIGNVHVYLDEPVPQEIEEVCSGRSGSFLLRVPSGRLSVVGLGTGSPETAEPPEVHAVEVPSGDYAVSVLDGSIKDISAVGTQQQALVDSADWRLFERVNHFGAFGCLAIALGMLFVLIPHTRREYWFLLPLFLVPACAYSLLRRLPGYARVSQRCREHEAGLPQYAVSMKRVDTAEGLEGGWYRSQ